jgi:membrane protein YqaA with SNARE-associated domain
MSAFKKYLGILLAVIVSILVFLFRDSFVNLKAYGLVGIFLISVLGNATIILPVPVVLTAFVGGSVYNPILVSVITALGPTIGELTGYLAGLSGQEIVLENEKAQKIKFWYKVGG